MNARGGVLLWCDRVEAVAGDTDFEGVEQVAADVDVGPLDVSLGRP
jgi:hypothetical protein